MEDKLANPHPWYQCDGGLVQGVLQFQGELAVPAWIDVTRHQVLQALAGAGGLEREVGRKVWGQGDDLKGLGQDELTGHQLKVAVLKVDLVELGDDWILQLHKNLVAKPQVDGSRIDEDRLIGLDQLVPFT